MSGFYFAVARPPGAGFYVVVFVFAAQTGCPKLRTSTICSMTHFSRKRKHLKPLLMFSVLLL